MQRVLIIENHLLVGGGIQAVLIGLPNLEVRGIATTQRAELTQEIERFQPDVIVLDEASHMLCRTILLPLTAKTSKLRIVVVNANVNLIHIYDKKETSIATITQFVDFIEQK